MKSLLIKTIAACVVLASLVVASGISGLLFFIWPTGLADHAIVVTPAMLAELGKLKAERKFMEDQWHLYPGAPNERLRAEAQAEVDAVIGTLIAELPAKPRRSFVLKTFKSALAQLTIAESEERDRFLSYLQRVMSITGVADSGELLNVWRYGFPYGWMMRSR